MKEKGRLMKRRLLMVWIAILFLAGADAATAEAPKGIYDFTVTTIDGEQKSLAEFKGKTLLIVNTASKCGFTPQYKNLQSLYETYHDRGFEVLGFPANNFLHQEPGSDAEIARFCELRFHVRFPLFSKISVRGDDIHPLYAYLISQPEVEGLIQWNFTKFLVNPEGKVVARFSPRVKPDSSEITSVLEKNLPTL